MYHQPRETNYDNQFKFWERKINHFTSGAKFGRRSRSNSVHCRINSVIDSGVSFRHWSILIRSFPRPTCHIILKSNNHHFQITIRFEIKLVLYLQWVHVVICHWTFQIEHNRMHKHPNLLNNNSDLFVELLQVPENNNKNKFNGSHLVDKFLPSKELNQSVETVY